MVKNEKLLKKFENKIIKDKRAMLTFSQAFDFCEDTWKETLELGRVSVRMNSENIEAAIKIAATLNMLEKNNVQRNSGISRKRT